ncbi:hypothetical protein [Streptomyces anulatus]|uniref:hypothetical protein n=1 Tax=Streptomyces anulatus TaxID=1892 RepID=UPI00368E7AD9
MPHSQFRGVGTGTWSPLDRAKALAYQAYLRAVCTCGTREDEWDPDLGGDPYAYVASARRCFGCEEIQREQQHIPEGQAGAGMKVVLLPASVAAAMEVAEALKT